jgi:hypothetical protein
MVVGREVSDRRAMMRVELGSILAANHEVTCSRQPSATTGSMLQLDHHFRTSSQQIWHKLGTDYQLRKILYRSSKFESDNDGHVNALHS